MKLFLLFMFCVLHFIYTQAKIDLITHKDECASELNVDKITMTEYLSPQKLFLENNKIVKDVINCAWKKEGILDDKGKLVVKRLKQFLFKNFLKSKGSNFFISALVTEDIMYFCQNVKGSYGRDTAVKITNCILEKLYSYGY